MENSNVNITPLLKNMLEKEIDTNLDEQTIDIKNSNLHIFLVKKNSPNVEKYSDIIISEIKLNGEIFFLCR